MSRDTAILLRFTAGAAKQILWKNVGAQKWFMQSSTCMYTTCYIITNLRGTITDATDIKCHVHVQA